MSILNCLPPVAGQKPSSNTAAVVVLAAVANQAWQLSQIIYSYSGTPTGGSLTIAWGSVSLVFYISAGGPGVIPLPPLVLPVNTAVTITLAAGGSGVSGSVYPLGFTG